MIAATLKGHRAAQRQQVVDGEVELAAQPPLAAAQLQRLPAVGGGHFGTERGGRAIDGQFDLLGADRHAREPSQDHAAAQLQS